MNQNYLIPTFLRARSKFNDSQVRFYESLAVPVELLEKVNNSDITRKELLEFAQWRLDYPIRVEFNKIDEEVKKIFLIALKILTRGRITLVSPFLEDRFKNYYSTNNADTFNISSYLALVSTNATSDIVFDGNGTEKLFYEKILPEILGSYYRKFVIPQVDFLSLVGYEETKQVENKQRVDFLISAKGNKIVVELDGIEHQCHRERDNSRDELLTKCGFSVIRINNVEIQNGTGPNLERLQNILQQYKVGQIQDLSNLDRYLLAVKLSHQIQITILEAILSGFIDLNEFHNVYFDFRSTIFNENEALFILDSVKSDLAELIRNISILYNQDVSLDNLNLSQFNGDGQGNGIVISLNENLCTCLPKFIVQEISFCNNIQHYSRPCGFSTADNPQEDILQYFLQYIFRKPSFREGQFEAISRAISGMDAIVLLPTGSGKSVAFQLASMLLSGVTIVIDPIISLIDDQIDNLERIGIDRVIGITSQITDAKARSKIIELFGHGEYIFCYIAPERFQTEEFRTSLNALTVNTPISLIAIDEAHCVSEWGHDFRTSYLNIGRTSREYCRFEGHIPPLLALTGTASSSVLKDVQRELQITDFNAIITPKTFDRAELKFGVLESTSSEKVDILKSYLQRSLPEKFGVSSSSFYHPMGKKTYSGLIFCPHVDSTYGVVELSRKLSRELDIRCRYYSGRKPKGIYNDNQWNVQKKEVAKEFKNNKFTLLTATKSFGMGIDKPNIRYTIHYGIPNSIESYYQEAGRAGRDRNRAECLILLSNDNKERSEKLLSPGTSPEEISKIMDKDVKWNDQDDVTRAMFFHSNSFKGIAHELSNVKEVIQRLDDLSKKSQKIFKYKKDNRNSTEKSIHRLLTLGVISDYTIDYSSCEFKIHTSGITKEKIVENYAQYVFGYNKGRVLTETNKLNAYTEDDFAGFVVHAVKILIEFIYDTIEKGRRRALREMLTLAEEALKGDPDRTVRERILRYLESNYSEEIDEILNSDTPGGFEELSKLVDGYETEHGEIIGGIASPKIAAEIRGQAARYLESTPDHPGLLFLRALSEIYCKDFNLGIVTENILAGIRFSFERYNIEKNSLYKILSWLITIIYKRAGRSVYSNLITKLLYNFNDPDFARYVLKNDEATSEMLYEPSVYLLNRCSKEAVIILN